MSTHIADTFIRTSSEQMMQMPRQSFSNPIYDGADPYVVRHNDLYYSCTVGKGGRIEVWKSDEITRRGQSAMVWAPPLGGWNRAEVWAPELHYIRGLWYIYYAASDGKNANHRMGVLRALTDDPQGPYADLGQMYTGDDLQGRTNNRWAIDGTVLEVNDQLYFVWSGWEDHRDIQHLYIARMSSPSVISSNRVQLCPNNCHEWEHVGETRNERGLHEGPAILRRHGRVFLVYSCSGSWQPTYKLGMLIMSENGDPMDPKSWTKHHQPILHGTENVFGIGHCSFTTSTDGHEDWILFHSKKSRRDGWARSVHAQQFSWTATGLPDFGTPVSTRRQIPNPRRRPARRRAA